MLVEDWLARNAELLEKEEVAKSEIQYRPLPAEAAESAERSELIAVTRKVDPLLSDILETEGEIIAFTKSLEQSASSPEERAVLVEAFLEHNKARLAEYEGLKFQLSDRVAAQRMPLPLNLWVKSLANCREAARAS